MAYSPQRMPYQRRFRKPIVPDTDIHTLKVASVVHQMVVR